MNFSSFRKNAPAISSVLLLLGTVLPALAINDIPTGQEFLIQGTSAGGVNISSPGFEIFGTLRLESSAGSQSGLTISSGILTNNASGLIAINLGNGGTRNITGNVRNFGTFNANMSLDLTAAGGSFENFGFFNIATGTVSAGGAGYRFIQSDGTLAGAGTLSGLGISFEYLGGTISGTPILLRNSALTIGPDAINAASFTQTGNGTFSGDIKNGQLVWIQGNGGGPATMATTNGFNNSGTLQLEAFSSSSSSMIITNGALTNMPAGVINVNPGNGGTRTISANVINLGAFNINYGLTLSRSAGVYNNAGSLTIASSRTLSISGQQQVFNQSGGTLVSSGTFSGDNMSFNYLGGSITGTPILLRSSALTIGQDAINPASFTQTGSGTFSGDIKNGQLVWIQGNGGGPATMATTNGFNNSGTLQLEAFSSSSSSMIITNGALTNMPAGVINVNPGNGGTRTISANVINLGAFNINYGLTLSRSAGVYNNAGSLTIASSRTLSISGQQQVFNQSGGTLVSSGTFSGDNMSFNYLGGSITGTPILLRSSALTIGQDAINPASFTQTGNGTFSGDIKSGQLVWIQGDGGGSAIVTATNGFNNFGTLQLEALGGNSSLTAPSGGITNMPGGVINVNRGNAGTRAISANVVNLGAFNVNYGLTIGSAGKTFVNHGTVTVAAGQAMAVGGPYSQFSGVTRLSNSSISVVQGMAISGGSLIGTGLIAGALTTDGLISMGSSAGILTINNFTQSLSGVLEIKINGTFAGITYDQLQVPGTADLAGKLKIIPGNGIQLTNGASFVVLTCGSRTGNFTSFELPTLATGLRWQVVAASQSVTLQIANSVNATFHISGTVTTTLGEPISNAAVFAIATNYPAVGTTALISVNTGNAGNYQLNVPGTNWTVGLSGLASRGFIEPPVQTVSVTNDVVVNFAVSEAIVPDVEWIGGSGDWNVVTNWSSGRVPGPGDNVIIDVPGEIAVTHSSGNHLIRSLHSEESLIVSGGSLAVSDSAEINNSFSVLRGAQLSVNDSFVFDDSHPILVENGALLFLTGNLEATGTASDLFALSGTVAFNGNGTSTLPQTLEAMSKDLGGPPSGFVNNFAYGTLVISNSTLVRIVDFADNSGGTEPEAVYVEALVVSPGATLDLNGFKIYAHFAQVSVPGSILNGTVTVLTPPTSLISVTPSASPAPGDHVVLTASPSGPGPFQYQWRFNGDNIPGANNSTYVIDSIAVGDSGRYRCLVINPFGAVVTPIVDIQVQGPFLLLNDIFSARPAYAQRSNVGISSNIDTTSPEPGEPKHARKIGGRSQWLAWRAPATGTARFRTMGSNFDTLLAVYLGTEVNNLQRVTSDDDSGGYFTSVVQFHALEGVEYEIAVDGFAGAAGRVVLSWDLEDTIGVPPVILTDPHSQMLAEGVLAELSVAVQAEVPLSYRWLLNGEIVAGANEPVLKLGHVTAKSVGAYRAVVIGEGGTTISEPAYIEISNSSGAKLSQDKLPDLFDETLGARARSKISGTAFPIVSAGVFGYQYINSFGATVSATDPNVANSVASASKWAGLTAGAAGTFVIDTIGSEIDTVLAVYPANIDISTLLPVAADDNAAPDGVRSKVVFATAAGQEYSVVAAGVNGASGLIKVNWILGNGPTILLRPQSQNVPVDHPFTLSVSASANPAPTFQWSFNNQPLAGETSPTLSRIAATPLAGKYTVQVSNTIGRVFADAIISVQQPIIFAAGDYVIANGNLELQIPPSTPGKNIYLESTTNFVDWLPVFTNKTTVKIKVSQPIEQNMRFFRTVHQ